MPKLHSHERPSKKRANIRHLANFRADFPASNYKQK